MRWVLVAAGVALSGCELVLELDSPPKRRCLDDSFDAPTLDPATWMVLDPTSPHEVVEPRVELLIEMEPLVDAYNGIQSVQRFDLTGGTASVGVVSTATPDGFTETTMLLRVDDTEDYYISVGGQSHINFVRRADGAVDRVFDGFVLGVHTYWRMRHDATPPGSMIFETSSDDTVWTMRHATPARDVGSVMIQLYGGTFQGGRPDPGLIQLDDFAVTNADCEP